MEWSPDSKYVMAAMFKRGVVQIFSLYDKKWACKITEGAAGISGAYWAPTSQHVVTVQDFQIRLTIWSLCENNRWIVERPKYADRGIKFSNNGKFLAVLERRDFKDMMGIYSCKTFELLQSFRINTEAAEDIAWSPDDTAIAVWDTNLEYNVFVYSPDARELVNYRAYQGYLGVKKVQWSKTGMFLSIGSFDQKLRLLNNVSWGRICEFSHDAAFVGPEAVFYEEKEVEIEEKNDAEFTESPSQMLAERKNNTKFIASPSRKTGDKYSVEQKNPTKFVISEGAIEIVEVRPDPSIAGLPKEGVGVISWSHDDRYILTKNDNMPRALWIWDTRYLCLSSIIQLQSPVRCAKWHPTENKLIIATGKRKIYLWTMDGCSIVNTPIEKFRVRTVRWHPSGETFMLMDKNQFCCCFFNDDQEGEGEGEGLDDEGGEAYEEDIEEGEGMFDLTQDIRRLEMKV
eukprot:CAMPEP_0167763550 /NCGR_PEP_ID=MMETSP0110_2-20121227/13449_1 /TAXON_ID=629695 /ORGANISM="Gymnochlora sp., Strain CCMP2014" /LENGTH=456 /DNA_ID=CAMNT_0007650675 /DNA_START=187 /DNA_END=1557 /DNA_ORIENTATION=+